MKDINVCLIDLASKTLNVSFTLIRKDTLELRYSNIEALEDFLRHLRKVGIEHGGLVREYRTNRNNNLYKICTIQVWVAVDKAAPKQYGIRVIPYDISPVKLRYKSRVTTHINESELKFCEELYKRTYWALKNISSPYEAMTQAFQDCVHKPEILRSVEEIEPQVITIGSHKILCNNPLSKWLVVYKLCKKRGFYNE